MTMPTDPPPQAATMVMVPMVAPQARHAFNWPAGSIRALLTLMVVGLVCCLMLMSTPEKPIPIPPYLFYLLFLILGHYFAARGTHGHLRPGEAPPLHLPRNSIRLAILAALIGTVTWELVKHPDAITTQVNASVELLKLDPLLPLYVLGGFFVGVLLRMLIIGPKPSPWWQDMEAWLALIATFGMGIALLVHLVIVPSLRENSGSWPVGEAILGGIVAFYFGARS